MEPGRQRKTSGRPAAGPDAALLTRLRRGEEEAFRELVLAHLGPLLAVARRFMRVDADARDVVQEAFLAAFKALPRFKGEAALGTWLHRITVNAALMALRRRRSRPEEPIEALLPRFDTRGYLQGPVREWAPAEKLLQRKETRAFVRESIDELPESYREILLLRDIEELTTKEAAEALEISTDAAKVRLHRARQALRTLLEKEFSPGDDS